MIVGIDDTDSIKGGCTTHLAFEIAKKIKVKNMRLIRLNPNIPFKTRGNGAVSFECEDTRQNRSKIISEVRRVSRLSDGAQPGVVFLNNASNKERELLYRFYKKVVSAFVLKEEAEKIARKVGAETFELSGGRGVVGALAAVGARLPDKTYELIAYRSPKNYGTKRRIDSKSVHKMNDLLYPQVFDSVELEKNSILINPRGRDPVFCGIRGESKQGVSQAWSMVKPLEEIEGFMAFESNQATDAHLVQKKIKDVRPYDCVIVQGLVSKAPRTIAGGHVFFKLDDCSGVIDCGAYKPTGGFRDIVRLLREGDEVVVCGGVSKYAGTVNLEKLYVRKVSRVFDLASPSCCGRRMTSAGKNKGFKCRVCGKRKPATATKKIEIKRNLSPGWFEVPPRARRHLSKLLVRAN